VKHETWNVIGGLYGNLRNLVLADRPVLEKNAEFDNLIQQLHTQYATAELEAEHQGFGRGYFAGHEAAFERAWQMGFERGAAHAQKDATESVAEQERKATAVPEPAKFEKLSADADTSRPAKAEPVH
jgi:flagellar biosynthesis/type III secretory pathway protein FliH